MTNIRIRVLSPGRPSLGRMPHSPYYFFRGGVHISLFCPPSTCVCMCAVNAGGCVIDLFCPGAPKCNKFLLTAELEPTISRLLEWRSNHGTVKFLNVFFPVEEVDWLVGCGLTSMFQLYIVTGQLSSFPNFDLLPGIQRHGQLGVISVPSLVPRHGHRNILRRNFSDKTCVT